MKQILLLFTIFAFAIVSFAQPTNSRLEADLKRLNRRFESVESIKRLPKDANSEIRIERAIQSAENELGRFKEKYPDQDVSQFEKDLANFKNPQTNSSSVVNSNVKNSSSTSSYAKVEDFVETIEMILEFRPEVRDFLQNNSDALSETKKQLEDFKGKINLTMSADFLEIAKDHSNRKIKRISDKASNEAKSLNSRLSQTDVARIKEETQVNLMLSKYFDILFSQEKIKVLNKIFAGDENIETANKTANELVSKLGTVEEIEKQGKANYAAMVAKNRMYPERQTNPTLKNQAITAFNSSVYRANEKGNKIIKVHLVSSGWSVERNKITGIILSREQQVQIAYKASDGKCYTYLMLLVQKHLGGGKYSSGLDRSGSKSEILCKNIPK